MNKDMHLIANPIAINSALEDFKRLKNVSREFWIGISKHEGAIEAVSEEGKLVAGFEGMVVGGFGGDPDKVEKVVSEHYNNFKNLLSKRIRKGSHADIRAKRERIASFAFLSVGLGGGTGSCIAPYVAQAIKEEFRDEDIPVVVVGVLPAKKEGSRTAWNAWRCLNKLYEHADCFLLIDNEKIAYGDMNNLFWDYNFYVARCLTDIIEGSVLERINPADYGINAQVMDVHDAISAMTIGYGNRKKPGFSAISRVSKSTKSLLGYCLPKFMPLWKGISVRDMINDSLGSLTLDNINPKEAVKDYGALRIPPHYLKGKINSDEAYHVLGEYSNDPRFGISITKRNLASMTVILTFDETLEKLKELKSAAADYAKTHKKYFDDGVNI
ncbi:MAG: hypothetical protein A7315_02285 [Candidatus Altiarchaeales archaeon WOR_SM1_79]|nr:MAG: hypothetical protein A7315_02285 [Candidatus Altiarchaeales archaeon WOR_SM1_79]